MTQKERELRGMIMVVALFGLFVVGLGLWSTLLLPHLREKNRQEVLGSLAATQVQTAKTGQQLRLPTKGVIIWIRKVSVGGRYIILSRTQNFQQDGRLRGDMDEREFLFPFMRDYMEIDLHQAWGLPLKLYILGVSGNSIEYVVLERATAS